MNVALDISSAARSESTGVAMFIHRMVAAFARVPRGSEHTFTLVTRATRPKNLWYSPTLPAKNFRHKWMLEGLHPFFGRTQDIFHGLDARLPKRWMKAKTVVTIHDVFSAFQSTQFASAEFRHMKRQRYQELVQRADCIVCVSEAVKRDVMETLAPSPEKLNVIYEAGGDGFYPRLPEEVQTVRKKYGLTTPYFLFIGSVNKRKNVATQIEAFLHARTKSRSDAVLAIAGRIGFGGDEIRAQIQRAGSDAIKLLGYIPDADVAPLYTGAQGLLFATLYEGFGIPAVEAFGCGCPVIGANVGSLPEIISDAGLIADPTNMESISTQISRLLDDSDLRNCLSEKGKLRAKMFSWEKAATEHLALYQSL